MNKLLGVCLSRKPALRSSWLTTLLFFCANSHLSLDPFSGALYTSIMRVIAKRTLREFWESSQKYADAQAPIEAWHAEALKATWKSPQELKAQFRNASILKNHRVVFNIAGNKYRLVIAIDYSRQAMFIKFIGTHKQYDDIDAENI